MGKGKYKERISETRSGYSSEAEDLCLADAGPWFLSPVLGEEDVGGGSEERHLHPLSLPDPTCASEVILSANLGCREPDGRPILFSCYTRCLLLSLWKRTSVFVHRISIFNIQQVPQGSGA